MKCKNAKITSVYWENSPEGIFFSISGFWKDQHVPPLDTPFELFSKVITAGCKKIEIETLNHMIMALMFKSGCSNINDLEGHTVEVQWDDSNENCYVTYSQYM